ncbi:class I SAM-dependent methyltransferase [Marinoscillum furvescens]|uniref:Methyltransferase family protein n=1 Tax=Marinoscillum furvescens DSM 4134 TaxID=1122208 RepID=A0A3D9L5F8_MARFU|nr:methyltransferase [Marinoscillum furvescens]RED99545.1 methyltransferase family protein [Marinoscillum furvescens DSM 4134]
MFKIFRNSSRIRVSGDFAVSVFRKYQNKYLKEITNDFNGKCLNVGSHPLEKDKEGKRYEDYFSDGQYHTLDINYSSDEPYHFQLDLSDVKLQFKFDLVLCMSVLEHVKNPFLVADNLSAMLKTGGRLYLTLPFFYPIHKDPEGRYSDYWRFTDDSIAVLFPDLEIEWIHHIPSVIRSVRDRNKYWSEDRTISGYCILLSKPERNGI